MSKEKCPIRSNRYTTGVVLGQGTWGTVFAAEDKFTGARVALKVLTPIELAKQQMNHRNLDPIKVMQREAGFRASRHVLPRMYDLDEEGKPFIIMPLCRGTLAGLLHESRPRGLRNSINKGYPDKKRGFQYMKDILAGLEEMHSVYHRTYGDWKPENIMVDENDRAILNDLGTASCISVGRSASPRDNMGHLQTRAQELFQKGAHPEIKSDIYGATALLYRIQTGEYPLEPEFEEVLDGIEDPLKAEEQIKDFLEKEKRSINKRIRDKINKSIPREFRSFYENGLNFDPSARYAEASKVRKAFDNAILRSSTEYRCREAIRKQAVVWGIPLFLLGVMGVGGYLKKFNKNLPPKPSLQGPLYLPKSPDEKVEEFDVEDIDLPGISNGSVVDTREIDRMAAHVAHDRTTAYLLAQYDRTARHFGRLNMDFQNDTQFRVWAAHANPSERGIGSSYLRGHYMVARNIEVALNQAKLPNGNIDLEDACAIARVGIDKINLAKRACGSFDYEDYISAKDSNGQEIIPQKEQMFLNQWLAYVHDKR